MANMMNSNQQPNFSNDNTNGSFRIIDRKGKKGFIQDQQGKYYKVDFDNDNTNTIISQTLIRDQRTIDEIEGRTPEKSSKFHKIVKRGKQVVGNNFGTAIFASSAAIGLLAGCGYDNNPDHPFLVGARVNSSLLYIVSGIASFVLTKFAKSNAEKFSYKYKNVHKSEIVPGVMDKTSIINGWASKIIASLLLIVVNMYVGGIPLGVIISILTSVASGVANFYEKNQLEKSKNQPADSNQVEDREDHTVEHGHIAEGRTR